MIITVEKAAELMGKSKEFVRAGLRNKAFPFGTAIKHNKRWSYFISPRSFADYLGLPYESLG